MTATESDLDYAALAALPEVDQTARAPQQRRPRFDGDVSELPDRACWALQHLLTRRYISAETDRDLYSWVLEYRAQLSVRLSELDLMLRVAENVDVAFIEQARYESARGVKLCAASRWAPTTPSWPCTWRSSCAPPATRPW